MRSEKGWLAGMLSITADELYNTCTAPWRQSGTSPGEKNIKLIYLRSEPCERYAAPCRGGTACITASKKTKTGDVVYDSQKENIYDCR